VAGEEGDVTTSWKKRGRAVGDEEEEVSSAWRKKRCTADLEEEEGWSTTGLEEEEGSDATRLEEEDEARHGTCAVHLPPAIPPPTQPSSVVTPPNCARADAAPVVPPPSAAGSAVRVGGVAGNGSEGRPEGAGGRQRVAYRAGCGWGACGCGILATDPVRVRPWGRK
jgi:hypothetical protein